MKPGVYQSNPEILGGTVVFTSMRVPVRSLFDYVERGRTLDYFLECLPSVKREQCLAALENASPH